ncbi:hypothetical protein EXIGLDRAFT_720819 [Exidia glandulosa HHB12029]|uniref:Uncharacterized protein n=1 Tax=Exidia glandulosa HHB12029 TaxID=1314781 RepID=A0A165G333_EXIGL|nr:hypothetical protein EXIGLDRAFT_720819 [Exidia glandulosa HHB12029]
MQCLTQGRADATLSAVPSVAREYATVVPPRPQSLRPRDRVLAASRSGRCAVVLAVDGTVRRDTSSSDAAAADACSKFMIRTCPLADQQHVHRAEVQTEARPFGQPVAPSQKRVVWPRKAPRRRLCASPRESFRAPAR